MGLIRRCLERVGRMAVFRALGDTSRAGGVNDGVSCWVGNFGSMLGGDVRSGTGMASTKDRAIDIENWERLTGL